MKTIKKLISVALAFLLLSGVLLTAFAAEDADAEAQAASYKNLYWPEGKIFPSFSEPDGELIAFPGNLLPAEEMLALASLQGFANAVKTRVVILDDAEDWLREYGYSYIVANRDNAYEYISKLAAGSVSGAVLYSTELSREYMNLASTVGNTMNAVPLTEAAYEKWTEKGIILPIVADLRDLKYNKTVDIYKYLYDNYWENCSHRILVVQRTDLPFHIRDLASAIGGAVVYLSCSGGEETRLFKKFLNTMTPGKSILIGWYAGQERELMTVVAQCGLSCVPADFFCNPTVFAQDIHVDAPAVPDMPALENKIYIAYFLSDGDNIQYDMHAMRGYWNDNRSNRGKVAVNWTISPALVDIAPGMMNYFYNDATEKECFVCGPSGMGYTMPINTFGGNKGIQFRSDKKFKAYMEMTDGYLQKAGLRAITVWDNLTPSQRMICSTYAPYLYGMTVQHFTDSSLKRRFTGVVNNMLFMQMTPGYFASNAEGTTPLTQIENDIKDAVKYLKYDGKAPAFVGTQVSVWAFHNIADVINLEKDLSNYYEEIYGSDVVEFVRADHFFNLYYESHGMPLDVTLKSDLTASASSKSGDAGLTTDGSCGSKSVWAALETGEQSVIYSLGADYEINEMSLYHAEAAGFDSSLNTRALKIEVSVDGENWKKVAEINDNTASRSILRFRKAVASYLKITITDPGDDGVARIADVDIFGNSDIDHAICPKCGMIHVENVWDRFVGFIHRMIYFFGHMFEIDSLF